MTPRDAAIAHAAACRAALGDGKPRPRYDGPSLGDANLRDANLGGANLGGANLRYAYLEGAYLVGADLVGAYLLDANLRGANLRYAYLEDANLVGANLRYAYLEGADLRDANLGDANLGGTILDPDAECPPCTDEQLRSANLEPRTVKGRQRVYGLRTARSIFAGDTHYTPKRWHKANALSVDSETECHPGIYLGGTEHATPDRELVHAWCYRDECVFISAKKGVRARRVYVLGVHCG